MNGEKLSILSVVFLAEGWALTARHIIFSILTLPITKKSAFENMFLSWPVSFTTEKKRKDSSFTIMGMLSLGL